MRPIFLAQLGCALLVGAVSTSQGYAADSVAGKRLTELWCTGCHVVGPGNHGTDAAPALPVIAKRKSKDAAWLRAWLEAPHPAMPNLNLSRPEIDDIVAYLASLGQH